MFNEFKDLKEILPAEMRAPYSFSAFNNRDGILYFFYYRGENNNEREKLKKDRISLDSKIYSLYKENLLYDE